MTTLQQAPRTKPRLRKPDARMWARIDGDEDDAQQQIERARMGYDDERDPCDTLDFMLSLGLPL
jgi:hypothetical protein